MNDIDLTEAVEVLTKALYPSHDPGDSCDDWQRENAEQALTATAPLIERAVREQIAAEIERVANEYVALAPTGTFSNQRYGGLRAAARIARGEVTP